MQQTHINFNLNTNGKLRIKRNKSYGTSIRNKSQKQTEFRCLMDRQSRPLPVAGVNFQ